MQYYINVINIVFFFVLCLAIFSVNPPYYVPLIEVVPAPWTNPEIGKRTKELMLAVGQKPVLFNREIEGFAVNRIQYVLFIQTATIFIFTQPPAAPLKTVFFFSTNIYDMKLIFFLYLFVFV